LASIANITNLFIPRGFEFYFLFFTIPHDNLILLSKANHFFIVNYIKRLDLTIFNIEIDNNLHPLNTPQFDCPIIAATEENFVVRGVP